MANAPTVPSGVQELINRLRDEGVREGQREADRILQEARRQTEQMLAEAKAESEEMRRKGRDEIEAERLAAHEAIRLAFRDTKLQLESDIKATFAAQVRRLVSMELQDRDFLRQLILTIVERVTSLSGEGEAPEIQVSSRLFATGENGAGELTEEGREQLHHFILGVSSEMLREGVHLQTRGDMESGVRVRLAGEELDIDIGAKAVSELLLKFLIPRFRAIVQGLE
jgi:V/A-type H+/Na+-transporting ATPase subunit E